MMYDDDYDITQRMYLRQQQNQRKKLARERRCAVICLMLVTIICTVCAVRLTDHLKEDNANKVTEIKEDNISNVIETKENNANEVTENDTIQLSDDQRKQDDDNGSSQTDHTVYAHIYTVESDSAYYSLDNGGAQLDRPNGVIDGLFTGRPSEQYDDMIQLNTAEGEVLVWSYSAIEIANAKVLPLGAASQFTKSGRGESACAAASLSMVLGNGGGSYEQLLNSAEAYADQGPLDSANGGMTFEAMQSFAKDFYGAKLVNAYSENATEVLKNIIDNGSQAIVLIKLDLNGNITSVGDVSHFIVVTGYIESEDGVSFIYANSYTHSQTAIPLKHISGEMLESSINSDFDESKAIAYVAEENEQ